MRREEATACVSVCVLCVWECGYVCGSAGMCVLFVWECGCVMTACHPCVGGMGYVCEVLLAGGWEDTREECCCLVVAGGAYSLRPPR